MYITACKSSVATGNARSASLQGAATIPSAAPDRQDYDGSTSASAILSLVPRSTTRGRTLMFRLFAQAPRTNNGAYRFYIT